MGKKKGGAAHTSPSPSPSFVPNNDGDRDIASSCPERPKEGEEVGCGDRHNDGRGLDAARGSVPTTHVSHATQRAAEIQPEEELLQVLALGGTKGRPGGLSRAGTY